MSRRSLLAASAAVGALALTMSTSDLKWEPLLTKRGSVTKSLGNN
jgi:hypothetical protein